MSIRNSAICRLCDRTGPKQSMHRVVKDGFVVGYEHGDCGDFRHFGRTIPKGSIYDDAYVIIANRARAKAGQEGFEDISDLSDEGF